jgi:hypothetical protein
MPGAKPTAPGGNGGGDNAKGPALPPQAPNAQLVEKVMEIQNRATPNLIKQKGIVGTATGLDDDGNVVIRVYTTGADNPQIPKTLENIPVVEVLTGPWHPQWQASTFNPRARQPRPVSIGVSAVNTRGVCNNVFATGTLGCRLKDKNGAVYALSNNHVFADENGGVPGDPVIQPGSLDQFIDNLPICSQNDVIGSLFKFKQLVPGGAFNLIDAAVVATDRTQVGNSTPAPPIAYGTPRTTVLDKPFLGLRVQKLGRTTGYTTGTVTGINQFVVVLYQPGLVFFSRQIEITGDVGLFSNKGDSGSLIVTMDRFPVGLLFAGGAGLTSANPIQAVLDEFDMTIDGDDSAFISPGKEGRANPGSP